MNQDPAARRQPRWLAVVALVTSIVALLLLVPQLPLIWATPAPLLLAGACCGLWVRGRWVDAVLIVAALLAAELWVEPLAGPRALAVPLLLLLALTGRPRLALWLAGALMGLLLAGVELKQRFAGSRLTWQDLHYFFVQFKDNVGVMASQPTLQLYAGLALAGAAACTWLAWRLDGPAPLRAMAPRPRRFALVARALAAVVAIGTAVELDLTARHESTREPWIFSETKAHIPVSTFLSTIHLQPVPNFTHLATEDFARAVQARRSTVAAPAGRPADIVVFLQESQFNPASIEACPKALCEGEAFRGGGRTSDDGELRVHTFGGGTWLSEFTLVTGVPHTLYGGAGQYASFNVAPGVQRSLVRSLKAAGYHTVAVYPVRGGMMNARTAYRSYGFDEFLDSDDLGLPGTFDTADALMHEKALQALERARRLGKPVFLLALTIFNHGEHGVPSHPVPADFRQSTSAAVGEAYELANLADYLWRTRAFEATLARTQAALLDGPTPTVLAWFGDHQPPFGTAPRLRNSIRAGAGQPAVPDRLVTWYNISSNLPATAGTPRRHRLDLAFLPGLLAQRAGVPLDDWLAANVLARERCGGLLVECVEPGLRDTYLSYLLDRLQAVR